MLTRMPIKKKECIGRHGDLLITSSFNAERKGSISAKHNQALFGKYFRDHLTENLKAKKQFIEALEEVSKSTNKKRPFREGP